MAVKLIFTWIHSFKGLELEEHFGTALLDCLKDMSQFAEPKQFKLSDVNLRKCEIVDSDERRHLIRQEYPKAKPIDMVVEFQMIGQIGERTTNIIYRAVRHTYENHGCASAESFINGKPTHLRTDLGGVALEDIWQDSNKWKQLPEKEVIKC